MTAEHIAKATRTNPRTIRKLLGELEKNGVFSRDSNGAIYSRRMVRDSKKSKQGQEFAERRWKRPPNGSVNGPGNGQPNGSAKGSGNGLPNAHIHTHTQEKGIPHKGVYPFPEARARELRADAQLAAALPAVDETKAKAVLADLVADLTGRRRYEIQEPQLTPEEQIALLRGTAS